MNIRKHIFAAVLLVSSVAGAMNNFSAEEIKEFEARRRAEICKQVEARRDLLWSIYSDCRRQWLEASKTCLRPGDPEFVKIADLKLYAERSLSMDKDWGCDCQRSIEKILVKIKECEKPLMEKQRYKAWLEEQRNPKK